MPVVTRRLLNTYVPITRWELVKQPIGPDEKPPTFHLDFGLRAISSTELKGSQPIRTVTVEGPDTIRVTKFGYTIDSRGFYHPTETSTRYTGSEINEIPPIKGDQGNIIFFGREFGWSDTEQEPTGRHKER